MVVGFCDGQTEEGDRDRDREEKGEETGSVEREG
jgi:hypothetical protein